MGLRTKAPYFKLVDKINEIISDGIVTEEEAEDLFAALNVFGSSHS